MENTKRKIIMDVDTGSDDAIALVMAMLSEDLDCIGITAVNGNVEVKLTTDNSLRVVECCDKQGVVPVYKGCDLPIASTLLPWTAQSLRPFPTREGSREGQTVVHGDHLPLPEPTIKEERDSAVVYLVNTLLNSEDGEITLVPVGPLTNIAMAMRTAPEICDKIEEIMIMGGGDRVTNASATAEFNIWVDPDAAEVVMFYATKYGIKVTWVPLDATHDAVMTMDDAAELRSYGTPVADAVADFVEQRTIGYRNHPNMEAQNGSPIHDAVAVLALIEPSILLDVEHCAVHVDFSGGIADGQTCIDRRENVSIEKPNCYFAHHADRNKFVSMMKAIIKRNVVYSKGGK